MQGVFKIHYDLYASIISLIVISQAKVSGLQMLHCRLTAHRMISVPGHPPSDWLTTHIAMGVLSAFCSFFRERRKRIQYGNYNPLMKMLTSTVIVS